MADYVLYVGIDRNDKTRSRFCPGSRRAIEVIDDANMQDKVTIQSVDTLRENMPNLPEWLKGTPTLVDRASRHAMRGTAAIEHLRNFENKKHRAGVPSSSTTSHSMDGMVAPGEQLHLGAEANFEPIKEDMSKYSNDSKVSDDDLHSLLQRRQASIPPAA